MGAIRLIGGDLDGLEMHYVEAGRGPATVLIHGLGGFAESWRLTMADLAQAGRVIALDLPGFGASAPPQRGQGLEFLARAVHGLLDRLDAERVRIVGHSLGGAVGAACAALFAERVERLALLGACVPGFAFRPSLLFRVLLVPGLGELLASFITPRLCALSVARCQVRPDPAEVAFFVSHRYAERTSPESRTAYLATIRALRHDFTSHAPVWRRALAELDRPVLVVHGRRDPVVPLRHAVSVTAGLRRAEAFWLDDCGHFPQVEHSRLVNEQLERFLYATTGSR
jgi:pimeloyl-ACP methyl ester carboxylesterase